MGKYMVKRILSAIPTVFVVMTLVFVLMRVLPGNPVYSMMDTSDMTKEEIDAISEQMGFNDSIFVQYGRYLGGIVTGDWGESYFNNRDVMENIRGRLEPTIMITICSTIITLLIGIPIGIASAIHRNTLLDYSLSTASMICLTIPTFWLGVMMVYFLAFKWHIFPMQGYKTIASSGLWQALYHVAMPSFALGMTHVASVARHTRSSMLGVLNEDYIRTAKAKGLSPFKVNFKHALKNTLSLIATLIAGSVATMLGGSTVVEKVFNIDGVGKLAYDSLLRRDYMQEQAVVLFMAIIFIVVNIILDILYKVIDPRIKFGD